jgi:hypothetical protein
MQRNRRASKRETLLAIMFAAGILQHQLPAEGNAPVKLQKTPEPAQLNESAIQMIAKRTEMPAEVRAYYLLRLAEAYLANNDQKIVDDSFRSIQPMHGNLLFKRGKVLDDWVLQVVENTEGNKHGMSYTAGKSARQTSSPSIIKAADSAVLAALKQLEKVSNKTMILDMYLIAENLFKRTGNESGVQRCKKYLDNSILSCEKNPSVIGGEAVAVSTILNVMANRKIPVRIPDFSPETTPGARVPRVKPFSEADFRESESLKLRAAAIIDRLSPSSHERRKTHRDLVLWYLALNKPELAKVQKQILFQLVGTEDEDILYAKPGGCGHVSWWQTGKSYKGALIGCGMG